MPTSTRSSPDGCVLGRGSLPAASRLACCIVYKAACGFLCTRDERLAMQWNAKPAVCSVSALSCSACLASRGAQHMGVFRHALGQLAPR